MCKKRNIKTIVTYIPKSGYGCMISENLHKMDNLDEYNQNQYIAYDYEQAFYKLLDKIHLKASLDYFEFNKDRKKTVYFLTL